MLDLHLPRLQSGDLSTLEITWRIKWENVCSSVENNTCQIVNGQYISVVTIFLCKTFHIKNVSVRKNFVRTHILWIDFCYGNNGYLSLWPWSKCRREPTDGSWCTRGGPGEECCGQAVDPGALPRVRSDVTTDDVMSPGFLTGSHTGSTDITPPASGHKGDGVMASAIVRHCLTSVAWR